jgi:hypothetical protein
MQCNEVTQYGRMCKAVSCGLQNPESNPNYFLVQSNSIELLPDLWELKCQANTGSKMNLETMETHDGKLCCLFRDNLSLNNDQLISNTNQSPHSPTFVCPDNSDIEFLLPDLHDLLGSPSGIVYEQVPKPSNEKLLIAALGIVGTQAKSAENQSQNGWHSELTQALKTLSAFEIVDHGSIDEE